MNENGQYKLCIKLVKSLLIGMENYNDPQTIQVLNLIFTHNLNYKLILYSKKIYFF